MDGGYTWDCVRGCTRGGTPLPDLLSLSANVRLGGFGYENAYYSATGGSNVDGRDWTLLNLDDGQPSAMYKGLDVCAPVTVA